MVSGNERERNGIEKLPGAEMVMQLAVLPHLYIHEDLGPAPEQIPSRSGSSGSRSSMASAVT